MHTNNLLNFKIGIFNHDKDLPVHLYAITKRKKNDTTQNIIQTVSSDIYDAIEISLEEMKDSSAYRQYLMVQKTNYEIPELKEETKEE